jgi:hypothetical protein
MYEKPEPYQHVKISRKEKMIILIAERPGLSTRKLQLAVNKREGKTLTYQAIRKTLLQLIGEGVIIKEGNSFYLDAEWVENSEKFYSFLKKKVANPRIRNVEKFIETAKDGDFVEIFFDSMEHRTQFISDYEPIIAPKMKKKLFCAMVQHTSRLFNLKLITERMRLFKKYGIKAYILYDGNTFLDEIVARFYSDLGASTKIGCDDVKTCWVNIYDDIIVQTFVPPDILKLEDKIYATGNHRTINFSIYDLFEKIYYKKARVKVTFQKNKKLAEELRSRIISIFDG